MKPVGLLAVVMVVLSGCATTEVARCPTCRGPVVYPPYKGTVPKAIPPSKLSALPADPGPGFLYTRVVYGYAKDAAYAYVVHVGEGGTRLLAVVGPLLHSEAHNDFPPFFESLCRAYGRHGPGQGVCCPQGKGTQVEPGGGGDDRVKKITLTPLTPPRPPPPSDGSALVYSFQDAEVVPEDPQIAGDAVGAASSGVTALNGG